MSIEYLVFTIDLQNLASIQTRTNLVKFARSPRTDPPGLRRPSLRSGDLRLRGHEFGVHHEAAARKDGRGTRGELDI